MGSYSYEAINKTGELVTGKLEAEKETAVSERLRGLGFTVIDIKPVSTSPIMKMLKGRGKKVSLGDLGLFSRQLAAMLDAGIPVTRSLYTLSHQVTNLTLAKTLKEIAGNVEGGVSLTEALEAHPHIFSRLYIGMVESGEIGGSLQGSLEALSEQLQKDKALRDNIRSATFYPMVVSIFAVLLLLGMMFFLVPIFMGFFPPDAELPFITQIIIFASDFMRAYWFFLLLVIIAMYFGLRSYMRSEAGRRNWDRLIFRLPAFGPLMEKAILARFARTLSTLMYGGIPVMQALESAGRASGNTMVEDAIKKASEQIREGKSIATPLEESGVFPPMMTHMISIGEETGALPELLTRIAEFLEEEVNVMTKSLTSIIEPILLIVVGVVVAIMLISLYLPIFTVITEMT